jgi:hypothetical protein
VSTPPIWSRLMPSGAWACACACACRSCYSRATYPALPGRRDCAQPNGQVRQAECTAGRIMTNLSEVGHCGLFCILGAVRLRSNRGANRSDRSSLLGIHRRVAGVPCQEMRGWSTRSKLRRPGCVGRPPNRKSDRGGRDWLPVSNATRCPSER